MAVPNKLVSSLDAEQYWQNTIDSLKNRNLYLLESGHRSDCSFLVGIVAENRVLIKAHSFLLANASPVFDRMFYGSVPESKEKAIVIEDIEPDDFKDLLKFIYTDEMKFESTENAQQLYCAANKYMLNKLTKVCVAFLLNHLTYENVCEIVKFAERFEELHLKESCLKFIYKNTSNVLKSATFYQVNLETLETIISQDELSITSELELFNALKRYARCRYSDDELKIQNQVSTVQFGAESDLSTKTETEGKKKRKCDIETENKCSSEENQQQSSEGYLKIKKLVKTLRFLTLSPNEFATGPALSNLLTQAEAFGILVCIAAPDMVKSHFPCGFNDSKKKRFVEQQHTTQSSLFGSSNIRR